MNKKQDKKLDIKVLFEQLEILREACKSGSGILCTYPDCEYVGVCSELMLLVPRNYSLSQEVINNTSYLSKCVVGTATRINREEEAKIARGERRTFLASNRKRRLR